MWLEKEGPGQEKLLYGTLLGSVFWQRGGTHVYFGACVRIK